MSKGYSIMYFRSNEITKLFQSNSGTIKLSTYYKLLTAVFSSLLLPLTYTIILYSQCLYYLKGTLPRYQDICCDFSLTVLIVKGLTLSMVEH